MRCSTSASRARAILSAAEQDWSGLSLKEQLRADRVDVKTTLAGVTNERETTQVADLILASVAFAARRRGQQRDLLIITDCRRLYAALSGRLANRHAAYHFRLLL